MLKDLEYLGSSTTLDLLRNFLKSQMSAKTFLFYGPEGVCKTQFAKAFAQEILLKNQKSDSAQLKLSKDNHPDLHEYLPDSKTKLHTIESMRTLIKEVALPPLESKHKVFIVYNVDQMQEVALQALLKTLEEPNLDTMIILVSNNLEGLLPTIRSRCVLVPFHALSESQVAEYLLKEKALAEEDAQKIAKYTSGNLKLAMRLSEPSKIQMIEDILSLLFNLESDCLYELTQVVSNFEKKYLDKQQMSSALVDDIFNLILLYYRDGLIKKLQIDQKFLTFKHLEIMDQGVDLEKIEALVLQARDHFNSHIKFKCVLLDLLIGIKNLQKEEQHFLSYSQ